MNKPVQNVDEIELEARPEAFAPTGAAAERYDARLGEVSRRIGARRLGYNITAIPPGKRAFPFHNHRVNEEMFFILEGTGEVRIGSETYPLRKGDFIACPPGGRETAHQIVNTGETELRFLAVSTMDSPELCEYPDSDKFAISGYFAEASGPRVFRYVGREAESRDYWEGE